MAQRHQAEVEIDSVPDQGTTVRLVFPMFTGPAAPVVGSAPANPPPRLRLLIVDDDPMLIKSLRDTLEGGGHLVTTADGGQAGIDAFLEARAKGGAFPAVL